MRDFVPFCQRLDAIPDLVRTKMNKKLNSNSSASELPACQRPADFKHHHRGKSSERLLNKDMILKALNVLPGQTILDAGCGNGYMAKEFSKALEGKGKVYALDPDEEAIKTLKRETKGTNIEPIVADITKPTPIKDSSIDLIYMSTVFHGLSKDQIPGFRKEAKRILKPEARLAIVEMQKEATPFGPPLDIRYSPQELKQTINLTAKATVDIGPYFYLQIFENAV